MKKGPFEVINSREVYKNPWITVREDKVLRPDKSEGIFGVVSYQTGAIILPFDSEKNVYCINEYMYGIERNDIMLPAGGIESGERPLHAAKRELLEETGLKAKKWISLGVAYSNTAIINAPFYMFLALDVEKTGEEEKGIKTTRYPFVKVLQMVENGKISHSGTLSTILKAKLYLEENGTIS